MNMERIREQGRQEAAYPDTEYLLALVDVARSLRTAGFSEFDAVNRIMLLKGGGPTTQRVYLEGFVARVFQGQA